MSAIADALGAKNKFRAEQPNIDFRGVTPVTPGTLAAGNAQAVGGAGPASGTISRQNTLSDMLEAAARGEGPSVAENMLTSGVSNAIARSKGAIASTPGVNPALAARMGADTEAGIAQNMVAPATGLRAGEIATAREGLGRNLGATGSLQLGQQGAGTALLGTAGGLDLTSQGQWLQQAIESGRLNLGAQQINAGVSAQNAATNAGIFGGMLNAAGSAVGLPFKVAEGGEIPDVNSVPMGELHDYLGKLHGPLAATGVYSIAPETEGPGGVPATAATRTEFVRETKPWETEAWKSGNVAGAYVDDSGKPLAAGSTVGAPGKAKTVGGGVGSAVGSGLSAFGKSMANVGDRGENAFYRTLGMRPVYAGGGSVPALVSPGEKVLPPGTGPQEAASQIRSTPSIPGQAKTAGNSPRNDTVRADLTPGSIVIPRTVVQSKNPSKATASFVAAVLRRHGGQRRFAGGAVQAKAEEKPKPQAAVDLSKGGFVGDNSFRQVGKTHHSTGQNEDLPVKPAGRIGGPKPVAVQAPRAQGKGRNEMKRRMSTSSRPQFAV